MSTRPALVPVTTLPTPVGAPTVVHLGDLRSVLTRSTVLIGEIVLVPGVLLYVMVASGHAMLGLVAVFLWRSGCIAARLGAGARVPASCWLAFALFLTRTVAGIAVSSVALYLVVPVVMCAAQGVFFLGSAGAERPVMMRLATDYADRIPDHPALRRLFAQLSTIWGLAHLVCAGIGAWGVTLSTTRAVAVTSGLGIACSLVSIGGCVAWGWWRAARIPDVRITCGRRREHAIAPVAALPAAA